jgi:hypothetical protein
MELNWQNCFFASSNLKSIAATIALVILMPSVRGLGEHTQIARPSIQGSGEDATAPVGTHPDYTCFCLTAICYFIMVNAG